MLEKGHLPSKSLSRSCLAGRLGPEGGGGVCEPGPDGHAEPSRMLWDPCRCPVRLSRTALCTPDPIPPRPPGFTHTTKSNHKKAPTVPNFWFTPSTQLNDGTSPQSSAQVTKGPELVAAGDTTAAGLRITRRAGQGAHCLPGRRAECTEPAWGRTQRGIRGLFSCRSDLLSAY